MIKPKITVNVTGFDRKMASLKENTPTATAIALTRTANYAKGKEEQETTRAFKSPTPFTQNAFFTQWATKANLVARVGVKNQAGGRLSPTHWLYPEVEGGARTQKAFERALTTMGYLGNTDAAVPTSAAPMDSYGNVSGGTIRSILNTLYQNARPYAAPTSAKSRKARAAKYFAIPSGQKVGGLGPGVYQRTGQGVRPLFVFTSQMPRYMKRLRFYETGEGAARDRFPIEMRLAMRQTVDFVR